MEFFFSILTSTPVVTTTDQSFSHEASSFIIAQFRGVETLRKISGQPIISC